MSRTYSHKKLCFVAPVEDVEFRIGHGGYTVDNWKIEYNKQFAKPRPRKFHHKKIRKMQRASIRTQLRNLVTGDLHDTDTEDVRDILVWCYVCETFHR